jgi:hypothetical protein
MKTRMVFIIGALLSGILALGTAAALPRFQSGAVALDEPAYKLDWWTVDGGGGAMENESGYSLVGTAGQPDPGVLTGGGYSLGGGFWRGGAAAQTPGFGVSLPVLVKD